MTTRKLSYFLKHPRAAAAESARIRRFTAHNRRVFDAGSRQRNERVVLVEFNEMDSAHIAYSYMANVLAEEYGARIVAYNPRPLTGWRQKLRQNANRLLNAGSWGVYESFGATDLLPVDLTQEVRKRGGQLFSKVLPELRDKRDLEDLVVEGVWIGDLIYDSYLMRFKRPTVSFADPEFQSFLRHALEVFAHWIAYFDTHDVAAVNVSHCVYLTAIPMRLAVARGIPAFQANVAFIYRLSPGKLFAYNDFVDFPAQFARLSPEVQRSGLAAADERITRRFAGEIGVDMSYSSKSAYGESRHPRLLRDSPNTKVLIATHCFFDSPHSYGNNLFPDFLEWIEYLGSVAARTDYDWYIKTHPDFLPGTMEIIQAFLAKNPKFTLLPSDASHNQIIAEGINAVLTVYGTIGFEYAAKGVPVINASVCNPHIAYDFNIHPRTVPEYEQALLNIPRLDHTIVRDDVLQYYFMRNIYGSRDIFFTDYWKTVNSIGGDVGEFSPLIYEEWLREWTPESHRHLLETLTNFIRSGNFRLDQTHTSGTRLLRSVA